MAKRKEVINGLHNVFTLNSADLYDISTFSYEQSVDENTILFAIADAEDVGKYITINGEPRTINENDNFIITDGIVFSGNGGTGSTPSSGTTYTAGTNIDITGNVISAEGYTYANENFYIGNETTYEEINDLDWDNTYTEERPENHTIHYNGADSDFDFNNIIKIGDFIRFFDVDNEGETICKVISVNAHNFSVNKFWPIAAAYTTVSKVVGGASLLAKNDGSVYVKNIGNYPGNVNYINSSSVSSLQDVINMNSEAINDLYEQGSTGQEYTGSDNIHISEENVITALGYNYANGVTQLSNAQINNDGTFHFSPASNLTSSYSNFDIKDTNVKIHNTNSDTAKVTLQYVDVESNSNITTTGSISAAQGFYETSDIRKKNVIDELPLDKAYELINNCQSIIYTLKDNTDKQQIGLIAQEVQQYFPEVVSENEDGYLSLDYAKLTSVIFRVLKDVIDRLNKLENK